MHHTHDDFLNAIVAQPADRTLRLVFADWLDEHDDRRGELIRIEEEMRTLPVFADRFWELKPRRNELRTLVGSEWCERMRYGTECEPVFRHGIPDGWRERWRLIREFTERWYHIPMVDVGGRQKELENAETRLKRKFPPSVGEWIAFVHDVHEAPNSTGELRPAHVQSLSGNVALSLQFSDYQDAHSAVSFADLHLPDPPVYWYQWDENDVWVQSGPNAESVTVFALRQVINHTDGAGGEFVAEVDQLPDLYRHLTRTFHSHVKFGNREWDETENLFVEVEPIPGQSGRFYLYVRAAASIRKEQIPEFLWGYARLSHSRSGIFERKP